jgi:hypothetical protein
MERVRARTKALTLFFMFVVFAISATVAFTLGGKVFGWSEPVRLVAASTLGIIGMVFDFTAYVVAVQPEWKEPVRANSWPQRRPTRPRVAR